MLDAQYQRRYRYPMFFMPMANPASMFWTPDRVTSTLQRGAISILLLHVRVAKWAYGKFPPLRSSNGGGVQPAFRSRPSRRLCRPFWSAQWRQASVLRGDMESRAALAHVEPLWIA